VYQITAKPPHLHEVWRQLRIPGGRARHRLQQHLLKENKRAAVHANMASALAQWTSTHLKEQTWQQLYCCLQDQQYASSCLQRT
jgi:hypothetical protein